MNTNKVWLITGASKGLGLTLAKQLLEQGYKVAATSRTRAALISELGGQTDQFLPLEADIVNEQSVQQAIEQTIQTFGHIDVVVNNAGYGQIGTLEELTDAEARANYDVNVFGLLHVIRRVMPHFRAQHSGHIFNISSVGGFAGNFSGWGIYCSTKFAVAGITEGLAAEAAEFGVNVTLVYPGYFRTNFLSQDSVKAPAHPIDAYASARASQAFHQNDLDGNQPGDPEKAAAAMIAMSKEEKPALHFFLGQDAYDMAYVKMASVQADLEQWKDITVNTDFKIVEPA